MEFKIDSPIPKPEPLSITPLSSKYSEWPVTYFDAIMGKHDKIGIVALELKIVVINLILQNNLYIIVS